LTLIYGDWGNLSSIFFKKRCRDSLKNCKVLTIIVGILKELPLQVFDAPLLSTTSFYLKVLYMISYTPVSFHTGRLNAIN
jgi:hypothetical protein